MRQYRWTPAALHDLRRQFSYWLRVDPEIAVRFIEAIDARVERLLATPGIGSPVARTLRKVRVVGTPFVILYRHDAAEVTIIGLRHGAENWRAR